MCTRECGVLIGHKGTSNPWELGLQAIVIHIALVLSIKLWYFERATSNINH